MVKRGKRGRSDGWSGGRGGGTLVLSVHHPEPAVREAAVRQLGLVLGHKVGC